MAGISPTPLYMEKKTTKSDSYVIFPSSCRCCQRNISKYHRESNRICQADVPVLCRILYLFTSGLVFLNSDSYGRPVRKEDATLVLQESTACTYEVFLLPSHLQRVSDSFQPLSSPPCLFNCKRGKTYTVCDRTAGSHWYSSD